MYWGIKGRFHDLEKVVELFCPRMVEFHLTDQDVREGRLERTSYPLDCSIHLPEYWDQTLIDPCNLDELKKHLDIYKLCIAKGLQIRERFEAKGKLKVILHPGGATVDPLSGDAQTVRFLKDSLYRRLISFVGYLEAIPEYAGKIEVLVENMPPLPWFYGGQYYSNIFCNAEEIAHFCQTADRGICFDVSHMGLYCNLSGQSLLEAIRTLKPFIRQVHLADASGTDGEGASIGEGNIDFKAVMAELRDIDAAVIPEQMWGHKDNYAEFRKTIIVCSEYLGGDNGTVIG